jgi:cytochrome c oxidase subunit 4
MFLRSIARAAPRSPAAIRAGPIASVNAIQARFASEHAIANPTIASIEKRWEGMPPQEQAELWMQLRDRMKVDWHQMTLQEKKAGMYSPVDIKLQSRKWLLAYPVISEAEFYRQPLNFLFRHH